MERIILPFHGINIPLDVEAYHHPADTEGDGKPIPDWWEISAIVHAGKVVDDPSDALLEAIESFFIDRAEARYEASITP